MARKPIIAVALLLTGCVTALNKDLHPYVGQPASSLFSKIGLPTDEKVVAGHKLYIWSRSQLHPSEYGTGQYQCVIRVNVDENDTILSFDWQGNLGGCGLYIDALGDPLAVGR